MLVVPGSIPHTIIPPAKAYRFRGRYYDCIEDAVNAVCEGEGVWVGRGQFIERALVLDRSMMIGADPEGVRIILAGLRQVIVTGRARVSMKNLRFTYV